MNINSSRLLLRALKPDDLTHLLAYRSDPEVIRYQDLGPMDREKAATLIEEMKGVDLTWKGKWMQIAIVKKDGNILIGDCALRRDDHNPSIAEIGYTLNSSYQGQGFAIEAVKHLLLHLFSNQNIHRVTALVDVRNAASFRLLEKLNFKREAHYRKSYFDRIDRDWFDEYRYALLKGEL